MNFEDQFMDLHNRKQWFSADLKELQAVIKINNELLDSANTGLLGLLDDDGFPASMWGFRNRPAHPRYTSLADFAGVQSRKTASRGINALQGIRKRKLQERRDLKAEIDDLQAKKQEIKTQ